MSACPQEGRPYCPVFATGPLMKDAEIEIVKFQSVRSHVSPVDEKGLSYVEAVKKLVQIKIAHIAGIVLHAKITGCPRV